MLTYICYSTTSTTKVLQNMLHICAVPYNVQQKTSFFCVFLSNQCAFFKIRISELNMPAYASRLTVLSAMKLNLKRKREITKK